jgi:hypothetical protein
MEVAMQSKAAINALAHGEIAGRALVVFSSIKVKNWPAACGGIWQSVAT